MADLNRFELTFRVPESLKSLLPVVLPYIMGQEIQGSVGASTGTLIVSGVDQSLDGTVVLTLVPTTAKRAR